MYMHTYVLIYHILHIYTLQAPNVNNDEVEADPVLKRLPDYTVCLLACMAKDVITFVQTKAVKRLVPNS